MIIALILALLGSNQLRAEPLPQVVRDLIASYSSQTTAPCPKDDSKWRAIPNFLDIEIAFALTEKQGRCEFEFYNLGLKDAVQIPRDALDRSLADSASDAYSKIHSHPLANVGYFAKGAPYGYEVMYADPALIATRQLPAERFQKLAEAVKQGRIPGYSLSPPSVQDFSGASSLWKSLAQGPKKIDSKVISSGGVWTYSINTAEDEKRLRSHLEYLVAFALQHEMATSGKATPPRRERARQLFAQALSDPEWKKLIETWRDTGFELRAPYSKAAVDAFLDRDDDSLIRAEYQRKLETVEAFRTMMKGLGVDVSFETL